MQAPCHLSTELPLKLPCPHSGVVLGRCHLTLQDHLQGAVVLKCWPNQYSPGISQIRGVWRLSQYWEMEA